MSSLKTINPPPKTEIRSPAGASERSLWSFQQALAPYVLVAPFIILFAIFMAYPLMKSFWLAFHQTNGPQSIQYVGFDNFTFMFKDAYFWKALWNTTLFAVGNLAIQIPISLGLALLLNSKLIYGRNIFRFAFFSPHLVGNVFVAVMFSLLFGLQYGLINVGIDSLLRLPPESIEAFLRKIPVVGEAPQIRWLGKAELAIPTLLLIALWTSVGFQMIYFLAGLQAVDKELYEAADIDGAGAWSKFWNVTLPQIKPVFVFVVVTTTIGSYKVFELPYVLFQGAGPNRSALTMVMYLFFEGFETGDLGYAAAIGWVLTFILLIVSVIQIILAKGGGKA